VTGSAGLVAVKDPSFEGSALVGHLLGGLVVCLDDGASAHPVLEPAGLVLG
jgi:hypothetical protein